MHQKGRFFASETLNYAFFSQKSGCFCTEMIHSVFVAPFWGRSTSMASGPHYRAGLQQS